MNEVADDCAGCFTVYAIFFFNLSANGRWHAVHVVDRFVSFVQGVEEVHVRCVNVSEKFRFERSYLGVHGVLSLQLLLQLLRCFYVLLELALIDFVCE